MNKPATFTTHFTEDRAYAARFTTAEFLAMVEAGAFADMKVELVGGELERMNSPMSGHGAAQAMVVALLWNVLRGSGYVVSGEVGIDLGNNTVLACDAAVMRSVAERRWLRAPDLMLVVEVAETTIARDQGMKRERYAAAGIATYWVVDGSRSVVHVYREPVEGDYAMVHTVRFGEPLAVPGTDQTIVIA